MLNMNENNIKDIFPSPFAMLYSRVGSSIGIQMDVYIWQIITIMISLDLRAFMFVDLGSETQQIIISAQNNNLSLPNRLFVALWNVKLLCLFLYVTDEWSVFHLIYFISVFLLDVVDSNTFSLVFLYTSLCALVMCRILFSQKSGKK